MRKILIISIVVISCVLLQGQIKRIMIHNFVADDSPIPTDSLVAYYPFNGNADDESGNGYDLTNTGAIDTTDRNDNSNSAYYFDGTEWMFGIDTILASEWAFACWFSASTVAAGRKAMFGQYKTGNGPTFGRTFFTVNGDKIEFFNAASYLGSTTIAANTWYFVVFDSDGYCYLNANTIPEVTVSPMYQPDEVTNVIGARNSLLGSITPPVDFWVGKLDDIRIYNKKLTTEEITALYNE